MGSDPDTTRRSEPLTMHEALDGVLGSIAERVERNPVLNRMKYDEFLASPEWQETRRAVLRRAGYHCERCRRDRVKLHVHHETYARRGFEDMADLQAICEDCHKKEHGLM